MRKKTLILAILANGLGPAVFAAVDNVRMLGVTHTQAVLGYTAPSMAACTVEVSKHSSLTPLAHDLNPALFSGAGNDGGGARARVFNIGKMIVDTASDGKNYSRSLQTATVHHYRVVCGADTATGTFETRNIPLGMTYVPNQQTDGVTGFWKQPYSSLTDRTEEFVDPVTGALLKKTMLPQDEPYGLAANTMTAATGTAWTSPNNAVGDDTIYASYNGTAQDKVVLSISGTLSESAAYTSLDYLKLTMRAYGDGASGALRTIQACISENGTTCAGTTQDIIFPSTGGLVYYNQSKVTGDLMGWTSPSIAKITGGTLKLLVWKKATSGSDTVFLDVIYTEWGYSKIGLPTSGGFHDVCSKVSSDGWTQCVVNGNLYGIRVSDGLVRHLGNFGFLNASVPGLITVSANGCETFGFGSRLWSATDPNVVYCNATLENNVGGTILKVSTDTTNTDKGQGVPANYFTRTATTVLMPAASSLNILLQQFDSTLPSWNCSADAIQGNYIIGGCRAGNQDTWAYGWVFSLGNGTAMDDPGCGTISNGKCQTSGVGIVAVNKFYNNPICRWCTVHGIDSLGNVPVMQWGIQRPSNSLSHGNNPGVVTLNGAINTTQTTINVASSYPSSPQSRPGTVSSAGTEITGTGTTFPSEIAIGDTITAGGQSRTVVYVGNNTLVVVGTAFSPDITGQTWTVTYPSSAYVSGDPISTKYPRFLQSAAVGDYFTIGSETIRITGKPSNTQWTISRGCSYWDAPCSGTGIAASDGASVSSICNTFTLDGYARAHYWNFVADPTAADTNVADPTNSGEHAVVGSGQPNGISGSHMTSRGKIRVQAGYEMVAVPTGVENRKSLARNSNYLLFEQWYFAGKGAPSAGNTYQRHPSNQHSDSNSGYQYDFFTDVTPLVGGYGFVSAVTPSVQVEGTLYRVGNADVGDGGFGGLTPDRKYLPTMAVCGYMPLGDISGPNSHIVNSATDYTYCFAEQAGECRNSGDAGGAATAGQHFMNCPIINTAYCTGGENYIGFNDTCVGNQAFDGNATAQFGVTIQPNEDTVVSEGPKRARVLAKVFDQPRRLPGTANAKTLPDASWIMHPGVSNLGNELFLMKNPGMPPLDSVNRQTFVPVKVQIPQLAGADNAYVEFGYDANFYCTARAESCVAAANNNPFFFAHEAFSGVSCASGCSVEIPSIPSRILRYRIAWRSSTTVLRRSSTFTLAVP